MENQQNKEDEDIRQCVCCKSNSFYAICEGCHFVCQECYEDFPTCPLCFGNFLPLDNSWMESVPIPEKQGRKSGKNKLNLKITETEESGSLVDGTTYFPLKKKKPIDQCKESFFFGVWDSVTSSLLSPKNISFSQFLATTSARIAKRMGKSLLNLASSKSKNRGKNESFIVPISVGLLLLLIGSQLVLKKRVVSSGQR